MQLRKYNQGDCKILYDWRVHPSVRAMYFNTDTFSYESHQTWFQNFLNNNANLGFILSDQNEIPVGHIRFEPGDFIGGMKISIAVSPDHMGKGYGTMLLEKACKNEEVLQNTIFCIGEVKLNNVPSQKIFEKSKFTNVGIVTEKTNWSYYYIKFLPKDVTSINCSTGIDEDTKSSFVEFINLLGLKYSEDSDVTIDLKGIERLDKTEPIKFKRSVIKQIALKLVSPGDKK